MRKKIIIIILSIFLLLGIISIICINREKLYNMCFISNSIEVSNEEIELALLSTDDENIEEKSKQEISDQIFSEKVLNTESKKRNIDLSEEEKENFKKIVFSNNISEDNKRKIESMNMTEEEFRDYLYEKLLKMQKRVELKKQLLEEINNNNVKIKNQEFKKKVNTYNSTKYNKNDTDTLNECTNLLNEYISIIESQYKKIEMEEK